jgi:hypothetical protein
MVVAGFRRNSREALQIRLVSFEGDTYVDMRVYFNSANGELNATKKGITLSPRFWGQFREGIRRAEEELWNFSAHGDASSPQELDSPKVVAGFRKNSRETLQICLVTFRGRTRVDIRLYFAGADGALKPTKKGFIVDVGFWDQFCQSLHRAEEELIRRNLWSP